VRVSSSASSGMFASMTELAVTASNVANLSTPGYSPARVVRSAVREGGVSVRVEAPPMTSAILSGTDLVNETINLISAQRSFQANLVVLNAEQEMSASIVRLKR
jgi:flagellar hook protein FlgE